MQILNSKRKIKINKVISFILVTIAVAMIPCQTYGVTKTQLQKQKNEAESKLSSANSKVGSIQEDRDEAEAEVEKIDQELVQLLATIDILEDELSAKKEDVAQSEIDYEAAKADEEKQYEAMKARIKFMYEQGNKQYVELLMESESIADAINKADYAEKVYDYDRKLLEEYQATKKRVAEEYERLVNEQAELEGMQVEYKEEQTVLEQNLSEKKAVVENFDEKLSAAKSEAKKYEAEVKAANTEIAKIAAAEKAAREKAEKEAKAKAEAEAKAKKEAEEKAKKESESSSKKSDTSNQTDNQSDSDVDVDKSQEGTYDDPPKSSNSNASVSGSGTGAEIASYACQFIGNPYVPGGTSLTNGTDCSGFTMSVYSHFGYSIPRNSSAQAGYGRGVSYDEAKAGDIMCYAGHVGIYLGNGMIVHASTPATGIKTSIATYRPIISIRRIVD